VFRSGATGTDRRPRQIAEYSLKLESNPEYTAGVLIAYARAAYRLSKSGEIGANTIFDSPPARLSALSGAERWKTYL
jgi:diaminopimelate dehydrogenase